MPGRGRALVGTQEGYTPCRTCRHARLRHLDRGRGACSQVTITTDTTTPGSTGPRVTRCQCPRFTTAEELF